MVLQLCHSPLINCACNIVHLYTSLCIQVLLSIFTKTLRYTGSPRYISLSFCVFLDKCQFYMFKILKYVSRSMNFYIENLKQITTWQTSRNKPICGWYISKTTCFVHLCMRLCKFYFQYAVKPSNWELASKQNLQLVRLF